MLSFLKNYSNSPEEKQKKEFEKNPELPSKIRNPEELFI